MKYKESEEMYLETILLLQKRNPIIRSIDIALELGYAKSSVSRAVGLLQKNGYIEINKAGEILLTKEGQVRAADIYERHMIITRLLEMLGASSKIAEDNACRIEHVISDEMFNIIKDYLNK